MDDIYYEQVLNRIIQGRLRVRLGDLVLYIYEPSKDILEESYEVYNRAKEKAYFSGSYIQEEVLELLLKNDMWSPFDDRQADELDKKIEDLKVHALQVFFKKKELAGVKRNLRNIEHKQAKLRSRKLQLDHLTCEGAAKFARQCWITQHTTFDEQGNLFNFEKYSISFMMELYQSKTITPTMYRQVARSQQWRSMWNASKQRGDVFGRPSIDLNPHQLALISYSIMYDNVYESPEAPKEDIINDDDCLDGWFIKQRRKMEKDKKQAEIDNMLGNSKVANSQEIFLMAQDGEEASEIYGLNNPNARNVVQTRQQQVTSSTGDLNFKDLADVKQDRMMNAVNTAKDAVRSKGR